MNARSVSASMRLGVVKPLRTSMPCAHEHDVEVHRPDGGDRERAHQSLGGADATGEYHGLVGAGLGEQVRDLYGVGDDGDVRQVTQELGERPRRGARGQAHRHTRFHEP